MTNSIIVLYYILIKTIFFNFVKTIVAWSKIIKDQLEWVTYLFNAL